MGYTIRYNISKKMSKKKKIILLVLAIITTIIVLATIITYFVLKPEKPWMAFYILCAGGVVAFNFLASIFLVNKNLK